MRAMCGTVVSIPRAGGRFSAEMTLRNGSFSSATSLTVPGFAMACGPALVDLPGFRRDRPGQHAGPGFRAGDPLPVGVHRRPGRREAQGHPAAVVLARVTRR